MQLVAQHGAQAYQLVAMPEQLPEITLARCRHPDFRKAPREQEIENESGVALIRLLFATLAGANLGRVTDPKFVPEFGQQTDEPVNRTSRFDAYAYRLWRRLQTPVERVGFAAFVVESPLDQQLCGFFSGHGYLLVARVKIASYNQHCSAL